MGDDTKPENTASQEPEQERKRVSVWGLVSYGIAKWILNSVPESARAAAVYDTPEYQNMQKSLQSVADDLYTDALDLREDLIGMEESSEQAERRANLLEDRLNEASIDLAHAQKMKQEAEARSKKAWDEKEEMGKTVISLRESLAKFGKNLAQKVGEAEEAGRRKANGLSNLVKQLSSAVSRLEAMEIVYHDSLDLVPGLVLCLDSKNGVAKASAGFKKAFAVSDSYFEIPLPDEVQARARPAGSKQLVKSRELEAVLANPKILERYNDYADYFYPQLWDEPHFSMVLNIDLNGRKKQYMANARILKKPVIVRDGKRQEVRFAYAGARVELEKVPNRLLRDMKDAISSFFRSRIAYSTPEGDVTSYDIDRAVKDAVSSSTGGEKEKKVLIDFTNAESVDAEAVKKTVALYQFFRGSWTSEKYFIVPSRLRGQFFDAGMPPRAMLLPGDYARKAAEKKKAENHLEEPGLAYGAAKA